MPQQPIPPIGADVSSLMAVGSDVSALMAGNGQPTPPAKPAAAPAPDGGSDWARAFGRSALGTFAESVSPDVVDAVGNGMIGILKGMGHTAEHLGQWVHKLPGVTRAVDAVTGTGGTSMSKAAFAAADEALQPEGAAQKLGFGAEQAAEFFVPGGAAERGAAAVAARVAPKFSNSPRLVQASARIAPRAATEGASAAGVSAAQGGDPVTAGLVGAAAPVVGGAVTSKAGALREQAEKQVEQFLGATKERYKAMAQRITPELLRRGIRGSREAVLERAAAAADDAGQAIDGALQQFGARQVGVEAVSGALERAKNAFRVTNQAGQIVEVEPRAIRQLTKLQETIAQLGPDATVAQMVAIRRAWDTVVDQAGGYAHRSGGAIGQPLKDTTEAWAKREGAGAIRKLLDADVPELSALNKEFSFWKKLEDVLTQTTQRTGPQGPGLTREIAGAAGAAAGSSGGIGAAFVLQKVSKLANAAFTSPRWRLASAQMKDSLANALMRGSPGEVSSILGKIISSGTVDAGAAR